MTHYRSGDHLRTPVDIAADEAEKLPYACTACGERHDGATGVERCPDCEDEIQCESYECPDCGDRHDGMTTGTERCPDCENETQCEGHESLAGEHMGESVYCDGSCRRAAKRTRNNGRA